MYAEGIRKGKSISGMTVCVLVLIVKTNKSMPWLFMALDRWRNCGERNFFLLWSVCEILLSHNLYFFGKM